MEVHTAPQSTWQAAPLHFYTPRGPGKMELLKWSSPGLQSKRGLLQVGLDVNVVAHLAWLAAPLQFVAGLGPRKSQLLSRAVQREEFVQTRSDLYKGLGILGKHVFRRALRLSPLAPP